MSTTWKRRGGVLPSLMPTGTLSAKHYVRASQDKTGRGVWCLQRNEHVKTTSGERNKKKKEVQGEILAHKGE